MRRDIVLKLRHGKYANIFMDFDGVIKDSVECKGQAFLKLFPEAPASVKKEIFNHHISNGGVSRVKKIPLYMSMVGVSATPDLIATYNKIFSSIVVDMVIQSRWIPNAKAYIRRAGSATNLILVTATPRDEIMKIVDLLGIKGYFSEIFGGEVSKSDVVKECIGRRQFRLTECLFIGDSEVDRQAATKNGIDFLLCAKTSGAGSGEDHADKFNNFKDLM